jgi:hypothetical protein
MLRSSVLSTGRPDLAAEAFVKRKVHAERGVRRGSIPNPVPVKPDRPRTSVRIYADATPVFEG